MNSYDIYEQLKNEKQVSSYRVSLDTGIPQCTFSKWKNNGYVPKYPNLKKIADYFNVSVDYFYDEV